MFIRFVRIHDDNELKDEYEKKGGGWEKKKGGREKEGGLRFRDRTRHRGWRVRGAWLVGREVWCRLWRVNWSKFGLSG